MKLFGKEIGSKKEMQTKRVNGGVELTIQKKGQPKRIIVDMDDHEAASERIWEALRKGHRGIDQNIQ